MSEKAMIRTAVFWAYVCMATAWILWSLDPIFIRLIGDDVSRAVMAGMSPLIAGVMMLVPAFRGFGVLGKNRRLWLSFACYIIFSTALAELMYVFAIRNLNPGLVSLILRSQVMMTILCAWMVFGERPNRTVMLGMAIVVIGYAAGAWTSVRGTADVGRNTSVGWICALAAAVLWTSGTILGKKLMASLRSDHLCAMRMLATGLVITVSCCCVNGVGDFTALSASQCGLLVLKTVICTAIAYNLYMYGLKVAPLTAAAAMEQAAPLSTLCIAAFFLHETISLQQWLTVAVVFAGAAIILRNQYRAEANSSKT